MIKKVYDLIIIFVILINLASYIFKKRGLLKKKKKTIIVSN